MREREREKQPEQNPEAQSQGSPALFLEIYYPAAFRLQPWQSTPHSTARALNELLISGIRCA
uniref:Uncharacterized protein n=1 Tax=Anguilla anguilla TaxID=7936 RepID=A0A0E9RU90_ANGAN